MIQKVKRKLRHVTCQMHEKRSLSRALAIEKMNGGGQPIELTLLLLAHSLEKGMGIENPRKGFGREKAASLIECLRKCEDKSSYAYRESLSVLGAYIEFSEKSGSVDQSLISAYEELSVQVSEGDKYPAGYELYTPQDIYDNIHTDGVQRFLCSRHSVRAFENEPISEKTMESILAMAATAPSACNRQPIKVYWTSDRDKVAAIDALIPGNKGFEGQIPNWAIITVDRGMFGNTECLQWYVNGGIYASHFVLACHANHIGSCIFQLPIAYESIDRIRQVAHIPNNYAIICAVGFGKPKTQVKRLMASRKPIGDYAEIF